MLPCSTCCRDSVALFGSMTSLIHFSTRLITVDRSITPYTYLMTRRNGNGLSAGCARIVVERPRRIPKDDSSSLLWNAGWFYTQLDGSMGLGGCRYVILRHAWNEAHCSSDIRSRIQLSTGIHECIPDILPSCHQTSFCTFLECHSVANASNRMSGRIGWSPLIRYQCSLTRIPSSSYTVSDCPSEPTLITRELFTWLNTVMINVGSVKSQNEAICQRRDPIDLRGRSAFFHLNKGGGGKGGILLLYNEGGGRVRNN